MKTLIGTIVAFLLFLGATYSQQDDPVIKPKPAAKAPNKLPLDGPTLKNNDLPAVSEGDQAVLPINYVKNRVSNMKAGNVFYVNFSAIRCDAKKKVWLQPNSLTGTKNEERTVQLKRDNAGYHLVFENIEHQWEASEFDTQTYLPVKSLSVK